MSKGKAYDDFQPMQLRQSPAPGAEPVGGRHCQEFATFDAAVDEFYSKVRTRASDREASYSFLVMGPFSQSLFLGGRSLWWCTASNALD